MATRINSRNFESEIKKIVNDIIPGCKNLYFHVGYFYFSGFSLIAKSIENKNIKILVGMGTDQTITSLSKSKKDQRLDYLRKLSEEVDKNEIRKYPHPRSIEGVEILSKYRGMMAGVKNAEAFFIRRKIS